MSPAMKVVRLHFSKRIQSFVVPTLVVLCALSIVLVVGGILLGTGVAQSEEVRDAMQRNSGVAQALFFCLFAVAVQAVATSYPIGRALGASRRSYLLGTLGYFACLAVLMTAFLGLLLGLELVTGHWFLGVAALDSPLFGSGNLGSLVLLVLPGVLGALCLGGLFGAAWLRFGTIGPWVLSALVLALIAAVVLVVVLNAAAVLPYINSVTIACAFVLVAAISAGGIAAFIRNVSVRGV